MRKDLLENLREMAVNLSLYSSTSYPEALACGISDVKEFFNSEAFSVWKKNKEGESKMQSALIGRLDGVIIAISSLGKVLARR